MAAPAPPSIVIDEPGASQLSTDQPTSAARSPSPKPKTPTIDTTSTATKEPSSSQKSLLSRPFSTSTTPASSAACYLCDEQNPGDFSPTTKYLDTCLLCSRYFCPIHKSTQFESVCNINHSTYYHSMLEQLKTILKAESNAPDTPVTAISPGGSEVLEGRNLAEVLINEGIFPSLGEREKAIFVTSPVDEQKQKELESFRSLDAAVMNGGERGRRMEVEVKEAVGADIAI